MDGVLKANALEPLKVDLGGGRAYIYIYIYIFIIYHLCGLLGPIAGDLQLGPVPAAQQPGEGGAAQAIGAPSTRGPKDCINIRILLASFGMF